jgi:hypothetical protein
MIFREFYRGSFHGETFVSSGNAGFPLFRFGVKDASTAFTTNAL